MIPHVPVITDVGVIVHILHREATETIHPPWRAHVVKYGREDHESMTSLELAVTTTEATIFSRFSLNFVFAS